MTKIIIIILILGALLTYPSYRDLRQFNRDLVRLNENIKGLEETNENLRFRIKALREDCFYIEKVAREILGLIRPGEITYKISSFGAKGSRLESDEACSRASGEQANQP